MNRTRRLLFMGEGSSDAGITAHIERITEQCGVSVVITPPDMERLELSDRSIAGKLGAISDLGGEYDLLVVHRDADRSSREQRISEIRTAVEKVMPGVRWCPVVPVRMTEAWLVLDEGLIRKVAGNPNGRVPLPTPTAREAETTADPKVLLKQLLATAADLTGRRKRIFQAQFPHHRRLILERTNPTGPVGRLTSWQHFDRDLREVLAVFRSR